jgi:hypothetical protein
MRLFHEHFGGSLRYGSPGAPHEFDAWNARYNGRSIGQFHFLGSKNEFWGHLKP